MKSSILSRLSVCICVCFSAQVFADQESSLASNDVANGESSSAGDTMDSVIVTSSFVHQNKDKRDGSLHVIGGSIISNAATQSLGESIDSLLGVASTDYGSAVGQPVIRGMSGNRVKVLNNGMVVRDVSALGADHVNDIDMNNIQQIEVIRGPSSLLYANGTIGGIINIVDQTIARKDFTDSAVKLGVERQTVNDGDSYSLSYENNLGGLNLSLAYKDSDFGNFDIPNGAILHSEEEHEEEGHHEDEHHEDEHHEDEDRGYLANSDFGSTTKRFGISKTGDWGYIGASISKVKSLYGIPFHGEDHGHEDHEGEEHEGEEHEGEEHEGEEHEGEEHEEERIFSKTDSQVVNVEGALLVNNRWLRQVNYYFRDSDYSLTEQHADGEGHHEGEDHEGEDHEGEEHEEHEGHHDEGPTAFNNEAKEYGAILDFSNDSLSQKVVLNLVDEEMSVIGSEAYMNPSQSDELTLGYFASKDFDIAHLDFGIRHDQINRKGSITHRDEHEDEHEDEHDGDHHGDHEDEHEVEMDYFDRNIDTTSFAFSLSRDINEAFDVTLGYAHVERAPSAIELFMNGPHLATGRFEVGNSQLDSEKSKNIDLTFNYRQNGFYSSLTVYKNDVQNYIYLMDETEEQHEEHDEEHHEGLILANYLQRDADFVGYEFELGKVFELDKGQLTVSFGRDSVSGEFAGGDDIPRMVPERNIYTLSYQEQTFKALLSVKDVKKQSDIGLNETDTDGFTMLDFNINKSFALGDKQSLTLVVFGNNLLDEVARNHASFIKNEVPLPGKNYGVKLMLEF